MFLLVYPGRLLSQLVYGPTGSYHIFLLAHVLARFLFYISCHIQRAKFASKNRTTLLSGTYYLFFIFIVCQFTSHFGSHGASTPHFISFFRIVLFICVSISPLAEYPDIAWIDFSLEIITSRILCLWYKQEAPLRCIQIFWIWTLTWLSRPALKWR